MISKCSCFIGKKYSCGVAVLAILVFAATLVPCTQGIGNFFTIYGQVFDTDGATPLDGVSVKVTNLETGSSVDPAVTSGGGWYSVDLGDLQPNAAHSAGDSIQIVASDGACKGNTRVVLRSAIGPQQADVILQDTCGAPLLTPTGLIVLVSLLSATAALFITSRKRR